MLTWLGLLLKAGWYRRRICLGQQTHRILRKALKHKNEILQSTQCLFSYLYPTITAAAVVKLWLRFLSFGNVYMRSGYKMMKQSVLCRLIIKKNYSYL